MRTNEELLGRLYDRVTADLKWERANRYRLIEDRGIIGSLLLDADSILGRWQATGISSPETDALRDRIALYYQQIEDESASPVAEEPK
jgi:hypothetical protein